MDIDRPRTAAGGLRAVRADGRGADPDDRQLADVVGAHQLDGVLKRFIATDGHHLRHVALPLGDEVRHPPRLAEAGQEPVLAHPVVVVDLGQVAASAVRQENDDQRLRVIGLLRDLQRRPDGEAAGAANQQPLFPSQPPRREERVPIRHLDERVDQRAVERPRPEILTDPLYLVRVDVFGGREDAPFRVGADHADGGVPLLEVAADAGDGAACADARDEVGEVTAGLAPDLRAGALVVGPGVHRVEVLVRLERVGYLARQAVGDGVVALGRVALDRGGRGHHLGAVGAKDRRLLRGDLVGHDEDAPVALDGGGHRQTDPGVAGGWLDDRAARLEPPLALGLLDHADADPVLDRTARVEHLQLRRDRRADAVGHGVEPHQRRVAQRRDNVRPNVRCERLLGRVRYGLGSRSGNGRRRHGGVLRCGGQAAAREISGRGARQTPIAAPAA